KMPSVVYGETWYFTLNDFYKDIGLTKEEVKSYQRRHKTDLKTSLVEMQELTQSRYMEISTGKYLTKLELEEKYKMNISKIKGTLAVLKEVKVYPKMKFNVNNYYAEPCKEFKQMIK